MKKFFRSPAVLVAGVLPLCGILSSCARADVTRFEAESKPPSGDIEILKIADASGGKAVSIAREWQPLLICAPPNEGEAWTIWARYSGDAVLVKGAPGGEQKDLQWLWDKPALLTWKKAGRFSRAQIGEQLLVIRGAGGGQGPILDCIVFATDAAYDPNVEAATGSTPGAGNADEDDAKNDANINEGAAVALGMQDAPKGEFFEAENFKANGEIVDATGASGGKGVKSDGDWQPIISIPLPATGDAWKVWIRHKGGPMSIKTNQGDLWIWNKPEGWQWRETDVFSREDLNGKNLVIGRDAGEARPDTAIIDAVVFAPDKKRELPPDAPDAKIAAQKIPASIDWSKSSGVLQAGIWGINEQEILDPKRANSAKYQKLLSELNSPLIRIHQVDLVPKWTNSEKRDWDAAKIKAAFENSSGYGNAKIMICISELPHWIAGGKPAQMTEADEDAFAAWCARLVKVMRDDVKRKVDYWEITNEWDNQMEKAGRLENYWRIYNKCAAAMRKEDANAKLGGPALTWAKPAWINGFLENCPDAQFISWHNYATGDHYETNEKIYSQVDSNIGALAKGVMDALEKHKRPLETFLSETNVKYTWEPYERRHQNAVGSVFHALVAQKMAELGVTGVTLWSQKGKSYGSVIGEENKTFPSYHLYRWGAQHLIGKMASAISGDKTKMQIIAVTQGDGSKAVLLLNKANHALTLPAPGVLLPGAKAMERIDASGYSAKIAMTTDALELPGYSLSLLKTAN